MKNLSFNKRRMKRAVQLATIAMGVACTLQEVAALPSGPSYTPLSGVWTVNGSTVTAGASSSTASFRALGTTSYNVTVNSGVNLSNNGSMVLSPNLITLGQGSVTNNGSITASSSSATSSTSGVYFFSLAPISSSTVTNTGSITARNSSGSAYGVSFTSNGSDLVSNSGSITASGGAGTSAGVFINAMGPSFNGAIITNQGTISGFSTDGTGYGIYNSAANLFSVTSTTGTITGSTTGILSTTGTTNINLLGGTVSGLSGYAASIVTGTINIFGRSQLVAGSGTDFVATGKTGQLNLFLVGGTPAQKAQAQTASASTTGSFVFGRYTYSWNNFDVNVQTISLGLSASPQFRDLASRIDRTELPLPYFGFYRAALSNADGALNELSGFTVIQGSQDLELNSQNSFLSTMENQLENIDGLGGLSAGEFTVGSSTLPGVNNTDSQLNRLVTYADSEMNHNTSNTVAGTDTKEVSPTPCAQKWSAWLAGGATLAHEDAYTGAAGYNAINGAPMIGFDYAITPEVKVGLLAAATIDGANFGDGTRVDANTELFGTYATWHHGSFFINGLVAAGPSQYTYERPTFGGKADADPDGYAVDLQSTVGYTFKLNPKYSFTPEVGMQYTHLGVGSYSETGAGLFNTNVNSQDIDSLRTHVGGKADANVYVAPNLKVIPEMRLAWYHECLDDTRQIGTSISGAPAFGSFDNSTLAPQRDYVLVGLGVNATYTGIPNMPVGMFLNYDLQVAQSDYYQHNVTGGVKVSF